MTDHLHFDARSSTFILRKQKPGALEKMSSLDRDKLIFEFFRAARLSGGELFAQILAGWPDLPHARLSVGEPAGPAMFHQDCGGMTPLLLAVHTAVRESGPGASAQNKAKKPP